MGGWLVQAPNLAQANDLSMCVGELNKCLMQIEVSTVCSVLWRLSGEITRRFSVWNLMQFLTKLFR